MAKFLTFTKDTLGAHAERADAEKHNADNGGDVIITTIEELLACTAVTPVHMTKLYNLAVKAVDPDAKEEKSIGKTAETAATKLFAALDAAFGSDEAQDSAAADLAAATKPEKKERKKKDPKEKSGAAGEFAERFWMVAPIEPKPRRAPTERGNPARGYNSINIIRANPGISTEDYFAKGGRLRDLQKDFKVNKNVIEVTGTPEERATFIAAKLEETKVEHEKARVAKEAADKAAAEKAAADAKAKEEKAAQKAAAEAAAKKKAEDEAAAAAAAAETK